MLCRSGQSDETASNSSGTPSEDSERSKAGTKVDEVLDPAAVEKRIVAKIVEICSPGKTGRTSKLMQQVCHDNHITCFLSNIQQHMYSIR